jgi:hypothetical protein
LWFIARHVISLSALANANISELHPRTWMMRLEPDVAPQGSAIIHHEVAHRLAVECYREVTAPGLTTPGVLRPLPRGVAALT